MTDTFAIDPALVSESHAIGDLALCRILLFDDARFPWLVLVPRRAGLVEITDLADVDRGQLFGEITAAMDVLRTTTNPYKLNVAALGNAVRQLHVHVIARFQTDAAWPSPVWGRGVRVPYEDAARAEFAAKLRGRFGLP